MSLIPSLLQAIVRVDGKALVLHVGDKPYVVSPKGQVDLATRGLTFEAVSGLVNQLMPIESQRALDQFGAAQYELPPIAEFPGEHFTIVAARGGDDVWAEIRRRQIPDEDRVPLDLFDVDPRQPAAAAITLPPAQAGRVSRPVAQMTASQPPTDQASPVKPPGPVATKEPLDVRAISVAGASRAAIEPRPFTEAEEDLRLPDADQLWPHEAIAKSKEISLPSPQTERADPPLAPSGVLPPVLPRRPEPMIPQSAVVSPPAPRSEPVIAQPAAASPSVPRPQPVSSQSAAMPPPASREPIGPPSSEVARPAPQASPTVPPKPPAPPPPRDVPAPSPPPQILPPAAAVQPVSPPPPAPKPVVAPVAPVAVPKVAAPVPVASPVPPPAVVLPLARNPIRPEVPPPLVEQSLTRLDRLLRLAAARGASTLYLSSAARPTVRVDGEIQTLDGAPVFGPNEVESLLLTLMPDRNAEALRTGFESEWIAELPDVGRVRCMSFRDHRGPGGVFRMMPLRAVTAEQLVLSTQIQSLANEPEGLVLIAGPRSSGKRTLISALVDLINRVRRDHVITIEREINVVHERSGSFISQREVRPGEEALAVARAALREDPDVLVIDELRSAAVMSVALDAAASGQLVIGGFPAPNASGAVDRIIDLYPPEYRRQVQLSLAQNLRGVVAQVLLRKTGGGRIAAREVLLNTPAVRSVLAEGRTSQLPLAIEGGRAHGMMPLNDALVGFVQSGAVDVREAYRRTADRPGFLEVLNRQGLDTSAIERYA